MRARILSFIKRPTSKDVVINTLGTYLNVFFTAVFALILVRIMSPAQYGVLSVLLGVAYVLANVLDLGVTATIYSYLPPLLANRTRRLYVFIKTIFAYQTSLSLLVIGVLLFTFPYLDAIFFKSQAPKSVLYLTTISTLFFIWQSFVSTVLFAAKKFLRVNIYLNAANVLKTLLILYLAFTGTVSVGTVIFVFGIVGPALFFLLLFVEKRHFVFNLIKSKIKREEFKMGYTVTYFVASQFFALGIRMDLFLLSFFGLRNEVGYYGLAQKIILAIISTVISVTQVLSPDFSHIKTKREFLSHFKTGSLYLLIPSAIFALLLVTPYKLYDFFFTTKFLETAPITRGLAIPFIIFTLGNLPLLFILYTFRKPEYVLYSNIIFFIVMTAGCYFLIPKLGVYAPAWVIAFSLLPPILIQSYASYRGYKKLPS